MTVLVNESPFPDMAWAFVRQIAPPAVTFALGRGWIEGDVGILLAGIGGAATIVYGQWKTWKRANQLSTIAASPETPDHVAQLK